MTSRSGGRSPSARPGDLDADVDEGVTPEVAQIAAGQKIQLLTLQHPSNILPLRHRLRSDAALIAKLQNVVTTGAANGARYVILLHGSQGLIHVGIELARKHPTDVTTDRGG